MALAEVTLDDKYTATEGRIYLTGIQALVRLPIVQRQRDAAAGLNTACFISGYRGSPLGGLDRSLWQARRFLERNHIRFTPGVNEDLAATAVWGSQQLSLFKGARYDGVFALWYGKGPGVDRSMDVLKHANAAGTSRHGGVLAVAGDDHACKSSTLPHQSEHMFMGAMLPVLHPANVQEILDYGLYGWALSRYSGLWVGFKVIADTADSASSVCIDPERLPIVLPEENGRPRSGLSIRWPHPPLEQEQLLHRDKAYAALAFHRANRLDRIVIDSEEPRLGIITTGKAYLDVRQALVDLGIDDTLAQRIGLRLYKVAMPWPLEPEGARTFARGLEEVVVVEEKRAVIENQLKEQLYNWDERVRPRVVGKFDEDRRWLLPSTGEFTPSMVAKVLAARIARFYTSERIKGRVSVIEALEKQVHRTPAPVVRLPYYCSGCPHNTSTKVPEGSRAVAGIGCHYMVQWMDRRTDTFTQMGGEGVPWVGQAPFTDEPHVFANLGDGTYYHSGILAIRAAISAGVNITYKILYNDAVAMTGGQPVEGGLSVAQITQQLHAEGVSVIRVVSDEPGKYPIGTDFAPGVTRHHRDEMDAVQKALRRVPGVTVIVYDQTCATEKRRRRKRGLMADPARRVIINELVCEGCGDCGVQSNCLSVEPVETALGRKRRINQSTCNKDFSCLKGFCPSFVTVEGGALRKPATLSPGRAEFGDIPEPRLPALERPWNIMVAGVGGTGVVTISAILGMAAHLEGKGCATMDQTGLAQKYGAVTSHIRIAARPADIFSTRIADGTADLLLGCDLVVAASAAALSKVRPKDSQAIVNDRQTPTAAFTRDPDEDMRAGDLARTIAGVVGRERATFIDATGLGLALTGDAIAANMFLLGHAWQQGLVPVSGEAIDRAIELNAVAVDFNRRAFLWGRRAAWNRDKVEALVSRSGPDADVPPIPETVDEIVAHRSAFLKSYQNDAYAESYRTFVARVETAEEQRTPGRSGLAETVARYLFKLMAIKDEYEVARLFAETDFVDRVRAQFEGSWFLRFHMAPPLIASRDPETGHLLKQSYGPWMLWVFRLVARMRWLRGTPLDIFGWTEERRAERALIDSYRAVVTEVLESLDQDNHALAVEIASIPEHIRGYGHVKARHMQAAKVREAELLQAFRSPTTELVAAE